MNDEQILVIDDGKWDLAEVVTRVLKIKEEPQMNPRQDFDDYQALLRKNEKTILEMKTQKNAATFKRAHPKVGKNDPCPCGSGKKYKNCHMREQERQYVIVS